MTHHREQCESACDADDEADCHLDRELRRDDREAAVLLRGELDHSDHQRDADRVVHARLALEDRSRTAPDLPRSEDRERHRGIRRRDRGADEASEDPVEAEDIVADHRDEPCGGEGSKHAEGEDRARRRTKPAQPDVETSVEQDDHECHHGESLDLADGDDVLERRERLREECRADQKECGVRKREPIGDAHPEQGNEDGCRHREHDQSEVGDLRQRHATESTGGIGRACR